MIRHEIKQSVASIVIAPRKDWRLIFNVLAVGIWAAFCYASLIGFHQRENIGRSLPQALGIIFFTLSGLLWSTYLLAKAFFYREIVTVDHAHLTIHPVLMGFNYTEREYDNPSVRNLRYEEWSAGRAGTQRAIRFEWQNETVQFAHQADASLCWDFIDSAMTVYPFSIPEPTRSPAVTSW